MIELIWELNTASSLLHDAIQRYITACYAIKNFYGQTTGLSGVPRALSDRVASELVSATSYETEVKRARSAICQARNCSPTVTPIQTLPTEVLAHIFQIVVGARPCNTKIKDSCHTNIHIPKYPDFLSHVCSRWRHVALGLPALWSHVDLVYSHSLSQGFTSRAAACAARAGHIPLDVHIRHALEYDGDESIAGFLPTVAKRISSLELTVPDLEMSEYLVTTVLRSLFSRCTPGIFTRLAITDPTDQYPKFIRAQAHEDPEGVGFDAIWLPLATKRFEKVLLPVTVLRLDGLYPLWTSQAYRGLVELYLTCTSRSKLKVSQSELYEILDNNPRLRVLELGLDIADPPPGNLDTPSLPLLHFEHLEVLNLSALGPVEVKILLSFITPGSNPLRLRIYYREEYSLFTKEHALVKFFKRSNITRLYVEGDGSCPPLGKLVELSPNLDELALDGFDDDDADRRKLSQGPERVHSSPSSPLKLYVMECRLYFDALKQVLEQYSIRELILWQTGVHTNDHCVPGDQVVTELSTLCPDIKMIPYDDPRPIEDWD